MSNYFEDLDPKEIIDRLKEMTKHGVNENNISMYTGLEKELMDFVQWELKQDFKFNVIGGIMQVCEGLPCAPRLRDLIHPRIDAIAKLN